MELRDLIKKIKHNSTTLVACTIIGAVLGIIGFFFPARYTASGSLFIGRLTENSEAYFTYEGYYGQQTALTFTNSISGLLESKEVLTESLKLLGIGINEYSLTKFKRTISVKKAGPQLITLTVKSEDAEKAGNFWNALTETTINYADRISENTDENLRIIKVSSEPVVSKTYKSWGLFLGTGVLSGFIAGMILLGFKEYFDSGGRE